MIEIVTVKEFREYGKQFGKVKAYQYRGGGIVFYYPAFAIYKSNKGIYYTSEDKREITRKAMENQQPFRQFYKKKR